MIHKTTLEFQSLHNASMLTTIFSEKKRKEKELKRLQTPNLKIKYEVKVKFQGLNPHPIFHVSKIEHKTSPALFEEIHIEFERDLNIPTITYGKITFCNPYLNIPLPSRLYTILYITNLIFRLHLFTFSIPITPSDTEKISHLTIQILQILWFLTMIVQNNMT